MRSVVVHGERTVRRFDETAAHYLLTNSAKASIVDETYLLQSVMPHIGALELHQVHDATLAAYVAQRLGDGRSHKTVNLVLGAVRRFKSGVYELARRQRQHVAPASATNHDAAAGRSSARATTDFVDRSAHAAAAAA